MKTTHAVHTSTASEASSSFADYLRQHKVEEGLADILLMLSTLMPKTSAIIRKGQDGYSGTKNVYDEKQLKLDVLTNDIFTNALQNSVHVSSIASEELETELHGKGAATDAATYSVAFDPLDGSSLVDVNLAVGSIFGFYKGQGFIGRKGSDQVAAFITMYGPRLTFVISIGQGLAEFLYDEEKAEFVLNKDNLKLADEFKMFAPGNLRACSSEAWYVDLLKHWVLNGYTLRYSGGMVPDVNQILLKGGGIFTYPGYKEKPEGKLRLLYECAPIAYLIEQAGGVAVTGKPSETREVSTSTASSLASGGLRILDILIEKLDQRTPIFLGSKKEVELVLAYLKKQ